MSTASVVLAPPTTASDHPDITGVKILASDGNYFIALVATTGPGLESSVEDLVRTIVADSGAELRGLSIAVATYLGDGDYSLVIRIHT